MLDRLSFTATLHHSHAHDSIVKQVSGEALYLDDVLEPRGTLHAYIAQSPHAHARIFNTDLSAVAASSGVRAVITNRDISGINDVSCAHVSDEPVFADGMAQYAGHPIFAVVAQSIDAARAAATKAVVEYEVLKPVISIDEAMTHHPHVSVLQQFVRTDDLDKIFAAANAIMVKEKPTAWMLKAFKYYYIPDPPFGLAGIVAEPTDDLHRLQDELITAVKPYTVKTGTPAAFFSEAGGRDIQKSLIEYVSHFVEIAAGKRFNPHVTIGVETEKYLNKMLAEPFPSFTFSPAGASVYQLGTFGTARKELKALTLLG